MRRFYSYGPVDASRHFTAPRRALVDKCLDYLVDDPEKGGHYFTIWAPRQTGKTWLMREVKQAIEARYGEYFQVGVISMQGVVLERGDPERSFLRQTPFLLERFLGISLPSAAAWQDWVRIFLRRQEVFTRPLILLIDEFDSLPPGVIERLVTIFRDLYLQQQDTWLHGLALIGVRAVLGIDSERGSPFNVQRALQAPKFTLDEVSDLFQQYQAESRQLIDPEVVQAIFEVTRGHPGLVCWFGELLTETYNTATDLPIGMTHWEQVYRKAKTVEWNNTLLNLIKKATTPYLNRLMQVFTRPDVPFVIRQDWCSYLYLNGIIDYVTVPDHKGEDQEFCRFACPFIQECLFAALADEACEDFACTPALEALDNLHDVLGGATIDVPALLIRYANYLARLEKQGCNPWRGQPRRRDLHLTEAAGHFHLYAWLREAIGRWCIVSPEFPTGNGRVDLHLCCGEKNGVIEVKSYVDHLTFQASIRQAAAYARSLGLTCITLAVFIPTRDEAVLQQLAGTTHHEGVQVAVTAIGWG